MNKIIFIENDAKNAALLEHAFQSAQIKFLPVVGKYNGTCERSFAVLVNSAEDLDFCRVMAVQFKQDRIAELNGKELSFRYVNLGGSDTIEMVSNHNLQAYEYFMEEFGRI
jgi:hypothetical protein